MPVSKVPKILGQCVYAHRYHYIVSFIYSTTCIVSRVPKRWRICQQCGHWAAVIPRCVTRYRPWPGISYTSATHSHPRPLITHVTASSILPTSVISLYGFNRAYLRPVSKQPPEGVPLIVFWRMLKAQLYSLASIYAPEYWLVITPWFSGPAQPIIERATPAPVTANFVCSRRYEAPELCLDRPVNCDSARFREVAPCLIAMRDGPCRRHLIRWPEGLITHTLISAPQLAGVE
jgi:hypothetical protein